MIQVRLVLDNENPPGLVSIIADGHASLAGKEVSLTCASFSFIVRTFAGLMETSGIKGFEMRAGKPGDFFFKKDEIPKDREDWFRGVSDILIRGIVDLERDYPNEIDIRLERR